MKGMNFEMKRLEKEGYIDVNGKPLKCLYCDSEDLIAINIMRANSVLEGYEVQCHNCKNITGHWAYGYWTLLLAELKADLINKKELKNEI